ncbi:efflux RND transporter periplasmic adaptor subunit [Campylobacter corcagiensis]|uniref:Efflux RND transporter periplasmic adaptor subunit n=1 Tax=Campylobacter corcagiensis TaxID=1448857 RepID=A0A7M1LEP2_9BACT|nr:efflux RND transporter periplasmic adaptor subunit [Campylobacter corcagiensis]QKF64795.1 macrolide-specific efflux protein, membrane fusion protein MacA [Campylobacter corcagiensis]QOQ87042.1 efflux RND transporter periplasmic adaptor subunit [Campylobacter corcagiensis]
MKKTLFITLLLACIGGFIYFKFIKSSDEIRYLTTTPIKGDFVNSVVATGEVNAMDLIDIGAQVSGRIEKLYVDIGDMVKKGDMIAQIEDIRQRNEVDKKIAEYESLLADLNATQIAKDIAVSKLKREEKLFKRNATSKESLEMAQNEAALKISQVTQINAKIKQNQIDLDTAMTNLSYTKITAPIDGTIVSTIVKEGQTVNANQTTPVIVQIADLTKLQINLEVAEGDLPKIKEGLKIRYSILANPNIKKESIINKIDPAMTSLSDGTLSRSSSTTSNKAVYYYAKSYIDNSDNFLKIGMTTQNEIIIDESIDTMYIPKSAVYKEDDKDFVDILVGNLEHEKRVKKEVNLGITDGFYVEIKSGLKSDDKVILGDSTEVDKRSSMKRSGGMVH